MPAPAEKIKKRDDDELNLRHGEDEPRKGKKEAKDEGREEQLESENNQQITENPDVSKVIADMRSDFGVPETSGDSSSREKKDNLGVDTAREALEASKEQVVPKGEDEFYITNVTSLDKENIKKILQDNGVDKTLDFPRKWAEMTDSEKRSWLREQGISVIFKTGGGELNDFLAGLPDEAIVTGDLGNYIQEIKRVAEGTASEAGKANQLQGIEQELRRSKLRGEISASDNLTTQVQEALSQGINDYQVEALRDQANREVETSGRGRFPHDTEYEVPAKDAADRLIELATAGTLTGPDFENAKQEVFDKIDEVEALVTAVEPSNYGQAYYTAKGLRESIEEKMDAFGNLPEDIRTKLTNAYKGRESLLSKLDHKFQSKLNKMSKDLQHSKIGDIDTNAAIYLKQINSGFGITIDGAKIDLKNRIGDDPIREWRVYKSIDSLDEAVRVQHLTETPVIWKEVPDKLSSVYTQMESMDFTVEELQVVTNQAIQLVRSVTPDNPEGRDLRDRLVDELEAFRAFHSMRITMERNDMDPERMLEIFQTYFKDDTWQHFAERFGRDTKSRDFLVIKKDENGNYLDKEGNILGTDQTAKDRAERENINVFDIAFSQYSERLRQERIKMNMVEELTKHAIQNPFSEATIREIEKGMRISLTAEQRAEIENLRQYFVEKTQDVIDGNDPRWGDKLQGLTVDEVWARKGKKNGVELLKGFGAVTHELVQDWSTKHTLQGAFGNVEERDLEDLGLEFREKILEKFREEHGGIDPTDDEFIESVRQTFLGKNFLQIRREQMRDMLSSDIKAKGVEVDLGNGESEDVDFDELLQSGYLDSVDSNAYYTTWMFEWSNYDGIRVYSRDTKSNLDDDFESMVFHKSTNLFYGRHIDHIWEFFHDTNENRGRPKDNDVNKIWKQYLPGKHHYLFPQNSVMVRWTENFMSSEQKATLNRRIQEMMKQYDFDNEKYHDEFAGWMKSAALMDMIESGEVSMSAADNNIKFSDVMKKSAVRKFEMIDVFVDRGKHKKYVGHDTFQSYLANPTNEMFIELNNKTKTFYSSRAARQFPFMSLATRAHWEVNSRHRRRLFDDKNINSTAGEHLIDTLQSRGDMERKQAEHEKRKLLGFKEVRIGGDMFTPNVAGFETPGTLGSLTGTFPFRRIRQFLEFGREGVWEYKGMPGAALFAGVFAGLWGGFTEFLKQGVREISGGGGGQSR